MRLLSDSGAEDTRAGGKVSTLLRLSKRFSVPDIVGLVQETATDEEVPNELESYLEQQPGDTLFAVRSSANVEDSLHSSFAGVFESVLAVPRERVREAILAVLRSVQSDRARAYIHERRVDPASIRMGVGVQRMIASDVSGVAFSHLPNASDDHHVLIEAVLGLGELLVQGDTTPERWEIDRESLSVATQTRSVQLKQLKVSRSGGTTLMQVQSTERRAAKLTESQAVAIAQLALDVESELGQMGVDIEWCLEDDFLWLLQARPLTT